MSDLVKVTIQLPEELHMRLRAAATDCGVSMNAIAVRGIEAILDNDDILADLVEDKKGSVLA